MTFQMVLHNKHLVRQVSETSTPLLAVIDL